MIVIPEWARVAVSPATPNSRQTVDDLVLALSPDSRVVDVKAATPGGLLPGTYLMNGSRTDRIESPSWAQVLSEIDGVRTLREITDACRLSRSNVHKHARQALAAGMLVIRNSVLH